jgi:hypothetical protein
MLSNMTTGAWSIEANLHPVISDLGQLVLLAQVYEVQHILLKARAAKARAAFEKFRPKTRVGTNSLGHVLNVRTYEPNKKV